MFVDDPQTGEREGELLVVECDKSGASPPEEDVVVLHVNETTVVTGNRRELLSALGGHAAARTRTDVFPSATDLRAA